GHSIDALRVPEAEVEAEVALRNVASAASDLRDLAMSAGFERHFRADREPVLFATKVEKNPRSTIRAVVPQDRWPIARVRDDDIDIAIEIDVAERCPAAREPFGEARPCVGSDLAEAASLVEEDLVPLEVGRGLVELVDVVVEVAVRDEEVAPAVVIDVDERRAPAHVRIHALAEPCDHGDVGEADRAVVTIERV